jgi:mRNA interferase RelE/StbE
VYTVLITSQAERDLHKLSKVTLKRVIPELLALSDIPRPAGVTKLIGDQEGWRIRVGDYRAVYQIDDEAQTVTIVRVRHRRDVYR